MQICINPVRFKDYSAFTVGLRRGVMLQAKWSRLSFLQIDMEMIAVDIIGIRPQDRAENFAGAAVSFSQKFRLAQPRAGLAFGSAKLAALREQFHGRLVVVT